MDKCATAARAAASAKVPDAEGGADQAEDGQEDGGVFSEHVYLRDCVHRDKYGSFKSHMHTQGPAYAGPRRRLIKTPEKPPAGSR